MITKSLRWRLLAWIALLLLAILVGFGATTYQLMRLDRLRRIDDALNRRLAAITDDWRGTGGPPGEPGLPPVEERRDLIPPSPKPEWDMGDVLRGDTRPPGDGMQPPPHPPGQNGPPPDLPSKAIKRLSNATLALFEETDDPDYYYVVWAAGGTEILHSDKAPDQLSRPIQATSRILPLTRGGFREMYAFTERGDCLLTGIPLAAYEREMARYAGVLTLIGVLVTTTGLGGGWWVATRAMRPIERMSAAACRISAGNLSERIPAADPESELGRLADVLNSTFARLESAFIEQKRFTSDASHELRTPLTVMISEAQVALSRERSAADYRETIETCLGTAQQMRRLAESLLELARFDAGQAGFKRTPVDLAQAVRSGLELVKPIAKKRRVAIRADLSRACLTGDADRLRQVAVNLLVNAIEYNREDGDVELRTFQEGGCAVLTVADTGIGIAAEDLSHIFERFYRVDKARTATQDHTGLGLAIVKSIVDAHRGQIDVHSRPGEGARFVVRLPI